MTTDIDPYVKAMRDLLMAEHERQISEAQKRADGAAARGDEWFRKWHQDHVDHLRARPYPWEPGGQEPFDPTPRI